MSAVEIEEAISELTGQSFDPENFSYAFQQVFGNCVTNVVCPIPRISARMVSRLGGVHVRKSYFKNRSDRSVFNRPKPILGRYIWEE